MIPLHPYQTHPSSNFNQVHISFDFGREVGGDGIRVVSIARQTPERLLPRSCKSNLVSQLDNQTLDQNIPFVKLRLKSLSLSTLRGLETLIKLQSIPVVLRYMLLLQFKISSITIHATFVYQNQQFYDTWYLYFCGVIQDCYRDTHTSYMWYMYTNDRKQIKVSVKQLCLWLCC